MACVIAESPNPAESARLNPVDAAPGGVAGAAMPFEFLRCCARTVLGEEHARRIRQLAAAKPDWDNIIRQAAYHRILPLLFLNVKRCCRDLVPAPVWEQIRELHLANGLRNIFLSHALFDLLDLLRKHGIPAVPFKGVVLARQAFGSIALRSFVDLDILISPDRAGDAVRLLTAQGYQAALEANGALLTQLIHSENQIALTDPEDLYAVELHWELSGGYFSRPLDLETLRPRFGSVRLARRDLLSLGKEDLLIYLCVHGNQHTWETLDLVCCLAELLRSAPDLDWRAVFARAAEMGAFCMVLVGLQLADELLAVKLPAEARRVIQGNKRARILSRELSGSFFGRENGNRILSRRFSSWHLRSLDRRRDALRYGLRLLLSPTQADLQPDALANKTNPFYWFRRPLRLWVELWRKLGTAGGSADDERL